MEKLRIFQIHFFLKIFSQHQNSYCLVNILIVNVLKNDIKSVPLKTIVTSDSQVEIRTVLSYKIIIS